MPAMDSFFCDDGFLYKIRILEGRFYCAFRCIFATRARGPLTVVVEFGDDSHERGE